MATVIDVAKKANVSPSTVSRYIRKPDMVSKKKALLIKNAIQELGYTTNLSASFLKSKTTNLVGLVLPSFSNSFFTSFIEELSNKIKECGKQLLVFYAADQNEAKEQIKTLMSFRASSILFTLEKKSHTLVQLSSNNQCYFLQLFSDCFPQFDSVVVDDCLGTRLAVEDLINKGHKKILLIDRNNSVYLKRLQGLREAFKNKNLVFDEEGTLSIDNEKNTMELIKEKIETYKPTAILSVTESLSQQTCLVLQELGLNIPNDISLICYDDSFWAKLSSYSAVAQPMKDLIQKVMDLIMKKSESKSTSIVEKVSISPILVSRNSIKNI